MQNLWSLGVSGKARIQAVSENLDEKYRQRLADLGLIAGQEIQCIRKVPFGGPRVFLMEQSLISFDRDISENIFIVEIDDKK